MTPTHAISADEARRLLAEDRERNQPDCCTCRLLPMGQMEDFGAVGRHYLQCPQVRNDFPLRLR